MRLVFTLPLFFLSVTGTNLNETAMSEMPNQIAISGKAQLFAQLCSKQEGQEMPGCEPPRAVSAPVEYKLILTRPPSGRIATDRFSHTSEELSAFVEAFWRTGDGPDQHYVVLQTTILRAGNVLARCSRYESDDQPQIVNVGACQGADQDGALFGLSLQK